MKGDFFLADDPLLDRKVMIQFAPEGSFEWTRRLASAGGPLIQRLLDVGLAPDGRNYIIREVVEGRTLEDIGPDPGLLDPLRAALAQLHQHGLQHRDLQPSNIVLTPEGVVRLTNMRYQGREDQEALEELEAWFASGRHWTDR
ncbi:hypothetical protein ABS71_19260 [bacterium SCN 62-11]|nr:hypothetical protein [Candidatus Eremiobacteraeota bacterium]ODT57863.1 MAG: hypothetical protein ABS71_19260 [bacterium SCN 62-11]